MMSRPKVSIIVPVYNVEKYLDRCMQNLLNQTLKEIEIVMVDDESPDNSPAMCDEYAQKDSRVRVVHKKNGGLGFARNSGIDVATGEYVAFCDSDDWVELDTYEVLYNLAVDRKLDAVYTEFRTDYHEGFHVILHPERLYDGPRELEELKLDFVGSEPEYQSDVRFQVSACKAIYNLDIIKQYGVRFPSERVLIAEDLVFNLDFIKHAKRVLTTPLQKYYYWANPNSLTQIYRVNLWKRRTDLFDHLEMRSGEFADNKAFKLRLYRSVLKGIRSCIDQEILLNNDKEVSRREMNAIYSNELVRKVFAEYPFRKMPLRFAVYYKLAALRCLWGLKILVRLNNR